MITLTLKYKDDKKQSINFGSERIPLFYKDIMQPYFQGYNMRLSSILNLNKALKSNKLPKDEYQRFKNEYIKQCEILETYKKGVQARIDDFEPKAVVLIKKYHMDDKELYIDEFNEATEYIRELIENWCIDLPEVDDIWIYEQETESQLLLTEAGDHDALYKEPEIPEYENIDWIEKFQDNMW